MNTIKIKQKTATPIGIEFPDGIKELTPKRFKAKEYVEVEKQQWALDEQRVKKKLTSIEHLIATIKLHSDVPPETEKALWESDVEDLIYIADSVVEIVKGEREDQKKS